MRDGKKTLPKKKSIGLLIYQEAAWKPSWGNDWGYQKHQSSNEVRSRRIGGAAYQVPTAVRGNRKTSLSIRWLIAEALGRSTTEFHTFAEKLAAEVLDAYKNEAAQ